jgi:fibronectin type 3 domain-containing protein
MKKVTKSLTALLLALVMSLTLLPTQALAAESAAKPRSYTVSYTNPLYADIADSGTFISTRTAPTTYAASAEAADTGYLTTRAAVIAELRSQMIDRQSTIEFKVKLEPGTIDLKDWWQEAISHVTGDGSSGDFLRWQFKSYGAGATPEKFNESWTGGYEVTYTVMWYTTSQQETQLNSYIKTTILPQLALGGKTTYQKVQAIYNWITKNVRYDYAHLNDNTYKLQYTAYAAAINKTAVCQGYANLFYRLANDAGIDCRIITGTADGGNGVWGPHAWNIVKMDDGNYYCLDATWDEGRSSYSYFLKGTAAFNKDHLVDTGEKATYFWSQYPVSNTDFAPDAPAIPAAPRVTIGNSSDSGKPKLTWAAVDGAAKYEIYRSTQQSTGYSLLGTTTTSTSYVNTGAAAGKTYYYRVKAVNSAGTSAYSNIVSGRAKAAIPAAPRVTIGNSSASGKPQLTWAAVDGAAKYEIYRSTQQSTGFTLLGTTTSTSYVNTGAAVGKTYYYKVRALNVDGAAGAYSSTVSGAAKAVAPAAPTVTMTYSDGGKPKLTWSAVSGATSYRVYRSESRGTGYSLLGTTTSTSYVNTGAAVGKTYYYRVKAVNSAGTSAYSNIVSGTARTPAPAAPVLKGGTSSASGKPQLTWAAVDGAAKYDVYRSNSADGTFSKVGSTDKTTYVNTGAVKGVTYFYKIRAVGASGASGFSNTVAIHVAGVVKAPAAVVLSGIKADAAGITVTWKTTANADTYNVLRRDASNTAWKVIARGVSGTSYKDTTVARGVMYSYTVQGVAADGVTTGPYDTTGKSAKVTASASTTPGYVTMKDARRVTIGEKGILLTWTTATNAKTYNVYRAANPPKSGDTLRPVPASKWVLVAKKVSALSWKDTTGTSGTTYAYMVRGVAADGKTLSTSYNTVGVRATMP